MALFRRTDGKCATRIIRGNCFLSAAPCNNFVACAIHVLCRERPLPRTYRYRPRFMLGSSSRSPLSSKRNRPRIPLSRAWYPMPFAGRCAMKRISQTSKRCPPQTPSGRSLKRTRNTKPPAKPKRSPNLKFFDPFDGNVLRVNGDHYSETRFGSVFLIRGDLLRIRSSVSVGWIERRLRAWIWGPLGELPFPLVFEP